MEAFDVIVIGGGPGGYVAAVRAGQLGFKTALVEKEHLGGTCLNWGCIPTKVLLRNAEVIHLLSKGRTFGFNFDNLSIDYEAAYKRSRSIVSRQTKRVALLMKKNGIAVYEGSARLKNEDEVVVEPFGDILTAKSIIVATGAKPRPFPGAGFDHEKIINFRDALSLTSLPASATIIGAGPIGMEFATIWNRYGTRVTVVEMMPHVLPLEDEAISIEAEKQFKRSGISIKTGAAVKEITISPGGVETTVSVGENTAVLSSKVVLVSIGFAANSGGIGLGKLGVALTRSNIEVDHSMRTSIPGLYAIGDVTGKMGLAHVASAQGLIAAETIAGRQTHSLSYTDIPRCTYAQPEVASVGLTEKQAREKGYNIAIAQCPFAANAKAMAMDDNTGFVKILADQKNGRILGVHLVGGHVTELVAGPTGMITLKSRAEDMAETVYPHPTLSEAMMEAAHALCGHAIHI
ncbi:dihydrolipoyl dehydrogenase [Desulfosarcina sp.]|uniref:dihydrolipoyl dehydrogenase n=1 Tax=Desulfosarcina sp. TaxID=2027861 RepID=UPI00397054C1